MLKKILFLFPLVYWLNYKLSFALLLLCCIFILLNKLSHKTNQNVVFLSDVFFLCYFIFSLYGVLFYSGFESLFFKMTIYPWLITFVFQNIKLRSEDVEKVVLGILISILMLGLFIFFQEKPGVFTFSIDFIINRNRVFYFRGGDNAIGPTLLSSLLAISSIFIIIFLIKKKKFRKSKIIILSLLLLLLLISGGRASLFALMFSVAVTASFYIQNRDVFLRTVITLVSFACALFIFFVFLDFAQKADIPLFRGLYRFNELRDDNFLTRVGAWQISWDFIKSNPFGYGYSFLLNRIGRTPHNEIVAQLLGGGFISALFFFALFIYFLKNSVNVILEKADKKMVPITTIAIICFFSILGLTENFSVSGNSTFYPIVWIIFGLNNNLLRGYNKKTRICL